MHRHLRLLLVAVVFAVVAAVPAAASAATPFNLQWEGSPQGWTASTDADFWITAYEVDANTLDYTCSIDGSVAAECGLHSHYEELATGPHSFTQTATNGDESETRTFTWVIDDGIGAYFYTNPDSLTNDRWAYFGWDTTDGVDHVECKFDNADWATCEGSTIERQMTRDGEHTFSLRAVDSEGGLQSTPTTYTWTLDTTEPVITTNLPNVVTASDFELNINVDDPDAEITCVLNEDYDHPGCDIDFSTLTDGANYIEIWATDPLGNEGYYEAHFGYQVGASVAHITAHPPRIKASKGTSTFEFTSDPGATFECSLDDDDDDFEPCTSPMTVTEHWSNEDYEFHVRAVNNGVTQSVPDSYYWHVGDYPFYLGWGDTPGGWTSDTSALFEVNVHAHHWDYDDLAFACSLDGSAFADCGHKFGYDDLDPGEHEVRVHATSKTAGGSEDISYNWRISDLPGTWFYITPEKFEQYDSASFYWGTSGDVNGRECKLDDAAWSECDSDWQQTVSDLAEGEHTFQLRARHDDILQDPVTSYTWTVDQTPPVVTASMPSGPITTDPYTLPISASEEGVKVDCWIDDGDDFSCDNGAELSGLSRGIHTISMYGYDRANNGAEEVKTYTFDWEPVAPVAPVAPVVKPAAPIVKPTLNKPGKPKSGKFTVPYSCGDVTCTLTVKFKLGKKTVSLKKIVGVGAGKAQLKLSKSQQKWLEKKGKKKATMTVTITGASGNSSQTLKF